MLNWMQLRNEVDAEKEWILDEKRSIVDILRTDFQQVQRNQFEAEKKVAVADTSIQNLQRAIQQIEEEKTQRDYQRKHLADELFLKEKELKIKKLTLVNCNNIMNTPKTRYCKHKALLEELRNQAWAKKAENWIQRKMNMIF